ncbi:3-hydroxyacyl-CoA dehydrogenase [Halobacillus sp. K22]|uniref:3-hydroxyacyl-CoA dehydrogenase n=1 Tax=Halobacillus sp. K22 TaxID=3457431 RepID=UPI003FCD2BB5
MKGKEVVAIVTGGASGLGEAVVRSIVENGGQAVIADQDTERGNTLAQSLGAAALFKKTDVTSSQQAKEIIDQACTTFGKVNALVNCAGIAAGEKMIGKQGVHSLESFSKVIQVNLIGTFNMIRLAADQMQNNLPNEKGERGVIVNTASIAAYDGQVGQSAYSASKSGVIGMTLPVSRELAQHGIRVMTIAPGLFETPMFSQLPESARDSLGKMTPFPKRLGMPEEFSQLVLAIFENVMLNGEVIRLDGAVRMPAK